MNRELLEKPFDKEQIKQRKGNFGDMIDYVETHAVIQRLNDAFDGQWSFEILSQETNSRRSDSLGQTHRGWRFKDTVRVQQDNYL